MPKTITTCAGIGDSIWLLQKLINQPDKIHWRIPGGLPRRGKQLFDLIPQVVASFDWIEDLGYRKIKERGHRGTWKSTPNNFYLEANTWLESGKRIEGFLSDLKTSYILPYQTTHEDVVKRCEILHDTQFTTPEGHWRSVNSAVKYIGIYTSAYETARHMGGWTAAEWSSFVRMLPPGYTLVFIGAPYDQGIVQQVMRQCNRPYIDTIGQPLPVVVEILKRLECFIGFPSGLSILNETLGAKKTLMFYPPKLQPMINAWADPARIESGEYKGCLWCEPTTIIEWMKRNWRDMI